MIGSADRRASVRLDPGEAGDLDAVMMVMDSAFDARFGEAWTRSQCAGILPLAGVRLTVASDPAGAIEGFSLLRTVADESELLLIAVAPGARRNGVGASLVRHFIEHGRQSGARRLHLEVRDGNPAIGMYRGFGFAIEGRRPQYYRGTDGSLHDALTMAREL